MPIGIQRLNNPHPQPSSQIVFIKPLPGPTAAFAQDFLERIAAICHPVMKANHLSIMTLEEHQPNPEFIGRNFNAGEIIQLVLKAPYSGHWLNFRTVQMVMMHELAHCVQMNHSKAFWKVRKQYAGELEELWAKGYTGDGLWGRGQTLLSGEYDTGRNMEEELLPINLCGGTFSKRRKRKRNGGSTGKKPETSAEKKQQRIEKKFGVNGEALGGDEDTRIKLEKGQKVKGKPRVANSARGRELRIAAIMARSGQQKEETKSECEDDGGTESENEEDYEMVQVCENEDPNDTDVKQEMDELHQLYENQAPSQPKDEQTRLLLSTPETTSPKNANSTTSSEHHIPSPTVSPPAEPPALPLTPSTSDSRTSHELTTNNTCPICSMTNPPSSLLCTACSHVLDTRTNIQIWRCQSDACNGTSSYINAADCGRCGVCGARKPAT